MGTYDQIVGVFTRGSAQNAADKARWLDEACCEVFATECEEDIPEVYARLRASQMHYERWSESELAAAGISTEEYGVVDVVPF
jgi:hypothetical protein